MRVCAPRAGGMGVPQMFELDPEDLRFLEEFARLYIWSHYSGDLYQWDCRESMLWELEITVERGGGEQAAEEIIDQYAAGMGLEPS